MLKYRVILQLFFYKKKVVSIYNLLFFYKKIQHTHILSFYKIKNIFKNIILESKV